jgi:hypothetical protein
MVIVRIFGLMRPAAAVSLDGVKKFHPLKTMRRMTRRIHGTSTRRAMVYSFQVVTGS